MITSHGAYLRLGRGETAKAKASGSLCTAADSLLRDRINSSVCLSFPINKTEIKVPDLPNGWRYQPEVPGER